MKHVVLWSSRWLLVLLAAAMIRPDAFAQETYKMPSEDLARLVDAPTPPSVSISPDGTTMLLLGRPSLPSIAELAEPELRIAGIRLNPRTNGPSRSSGFNSLTLRDMDSGAERTIGGLPGDPKIGSVSWSADGAFFAFTLTGTDRIDLYVASVADAQARRVLDAAVNNMYSGAPYRWIGGTHDLLVRTIPADRGAAPDQPLAPEGPIVQENMGEVAPARTYQDLLTNPYDEALFKHHLTTQIAHVTLDGTVTPLGEADLITRASPSPDGQYVLLETIREPFSYLVPASRFARTIEVVDLSGERVRLITELPVRENIPTGFGSVATGIRSVEWRNNAGSELTWVEALDGGDARAEVDYRDEMFHLAAPFQDEATSLGTLRLRYSGISWTDAGFGMAYESWWATRTRRAYILEPGEDLRLLLDWSYEDRYNDPGSPVTMLNDMGRSVIRTTDDGESVFMIGTGASPEGNRPFLRKMSLADASTTELFRSESPYYERPADLLDTEPMTILTLRESETEPPNYFVRNLDAGSLEPLTQFAHPYPELANLQKEYIQYERADGVPLTATLYLPPDYDAERDGPLPTFLWAYPREFKSASAAGQVSDSPYRFKRVSYWGAVPYVTQGYAILDNAAMPIIGEGDEQPNDRFIEQLVTSAQAAIDEGVRRGVVDPERVGVGGHSYGAFMTANLLAHSDLFRAGIARSGAYNRTLTPFGFQAEERTYWEAPEIYYSMSPFMHADDVNEPILLIHGEADNNSGTFPIQSQRYYNALKGMGKTARLVMLPHESHGYRARESLMHMLWEMSTWLDTYVKDAPPREEGEVEVKGPTGR